MKEIQNMLTLFAQQVKLLLGKDLKRIIVYGSYARGDYNENSDVDIMILTSLPQEKIREAEEKICDIAFDYLMKYKVEISVIVKEEEQFNYWLGAVPFYDNVKREGVVIG